MVKKLLQCLTVIGLTTISTSTVVACGQKNDEQKTTIELTTNSLTLMEINSTYEVNFIIRNYKKDELIKIEEVNDNKTIEIFEPSFVEEGNDLFVNFSLLTLKAGVSTQIKINHFDAQTEFIDIDILNKPELDVFGRYNTNLDNKIYSFNVNVKNVDPSLGKIIVTSSDESIASVESVFDNESWKVNSYLKSRGEITITIKFVIEDVGESAPVTTKLKIN